MHLSVEKISTINTVLTLLDIVSTSIKDSQGKLGLVGELIWGWLAN